MPCPCSSCTKKISCSDCGALLCDRCKQVVRENTLHTDCGKGIRHSCVVEQESRVRNPDALEAVAELLSGSAHSAIPTDKHKSQDYKEDSAFDLYTRLSSEVISLLSKLVFGVRVDCPWHKKEKWFAFAEDTGVVTPSTFQFIPPPSNGKNDKWNVSGWVKINVPEDPTTLDLLEQIAPGYSSRLEKYADDKKALINDGKLALTLLAQRKPHPFVLTSWREKVKEEAAS
jgi:hypothetical protein